MRHAQFNYLKYLAVALLMGGSVACETKSVESIIDRGEVRTFIAELHKAKTCEVYRVDDAYPGENRQKGPRFFHSIGSPTDEG